ncbi:MAG: hypothetical protein HS111_24880 [Kofleriaceae bacterium]|nr:hypothetical protein [Kofleriaceae bacterium]
MVAGRDLDALVALVERAERGDVEAARALAAAGAARPTTERAARAGCVAMTPRPHARGRAGAAGGGAGAGGEVSEDLAFRAAVCALAHVLAHPGDYPDETARERHSALCEAHAADPARLAVLRPLGERLRALEADGVLPAAMVVRSRRRRP